jgi:hypothetical protein
MHAVEILVGQFVHRLLLNAALRVHFVLVVNAVDFVNEHFVGHRRVDLPSSASTPSPTVSQQPPHLVSFQHGFMQLAQRFTVIVLLTKQSAAQNAPLQSHLRIYHVNKSSTLCEDLLSIKRVIGEIELSRKIPNLQLYKRAVGNIWKGNQAAKELGTTHRS